MIFKISIILMIFGHTKIVPHNLSTVGIIITSRFHEVFFKHIFFFFTNFYT